MELWLLILVIAATAPGIAQDRATVGDFTKSSTEHIIDKVEHPYVVRSVRGIISRKQGDEGPLPNVLFEIQGPGTERKIRRANTDEYGRFKIGQVPVGTYKFKVTLNGFQSVMGSVTVSKKAGKTAEIKIALLVGV